MESITAWRNLKSDSIKSVKDTWHGTITGLKLVRQSMREVSFDPIMNWAKGVRKSNAILKESYESLGARMEKLQGLIKNSTNAKDIEKYTKKLDEVQKAAAKHPGNLAAEKSKGGGGKGDKGGGVLGAITGLFGKGGGAVSKAIKGLVGDLSPMGLAKKVFESAKNAKMPQEAGFGLGKMGIGNKQDNGASAAEKVTKFQGKIDDAVGQVGLAFMPMLNQLMDFALRLADTLLPMIMQAIQPLLEMLNQVPIADILQTVMNVAVAIIAAIGPILEQLTPLFADIFEMLGPLITDIGEFIVALVEGLAPILALVAHIISAVLGPALIFIGKILGVVIDIIKWVVKIVLAILKPIIDFIALVLDGIMRIFRHTNKFNGKGADGEPKALTPPIPEKDSKVTAIDAGAQLNKGLAATTPPVNAGKGKSDKAVHKAASEATSGGPRVININGVKFAEKIELSVISAKEGINHLEKQLQEMFLRILNSGAVIQ